MANPINPIVCKVDFSVGSTTSSPKFLACSFSLREPKVSERFIIKTVIETQDDKEPFTVVGYEGDPIKLEIVGNHLSEMIGPIQYLLYLVYSKFPDKDIWTVWSLDIIPYLVRVCTSRGFDYKLLGMPDK